MYPSSMNGVFSYDSPRKYKHLKDSYLYMAACTVVVYIFTFHQVGSHGKWEIKKKYSKQYPREPD